MIRALLWKDFRLTLPVLLTGILVIAAVYGAVFLIATYMTPGDLPWRDATVAGTHYARWSTLLIAALLGGGAFAMEKEDESRRFLFALPTPRMDALISKFVVALLVFEILWLILVAIDWASVPFAALDTRNRVPGAVSPGAIAAVSFLVLSASWYWSARAAKPVIAAMAGSMTATVVVSIGFAITRTTLETIAPWTIPFAIAAIVAGARTYLKSGIVDLPSRPRNVLATTASGHRKSVAPFPNRYRALLWKDFRIARNVLLTGIAVLSLPYVHPIQLALRGEPWLDAFARTTTQTLWLSTIVFAVWGGYVVSSERATNSNRFLNALPLSSRAVAMSRITMTFLPACVIFFANLSAMLTVHAATLRQSPVDEPVDNIFQITWPLLIWQPNSFLFAMPTFGMPLVGFGVAWFTASKLQRPFLGIGLGAVTPGLVLVFYLAFRTATDSLLLPMQAAMLFFVLGFVASLALIEMGVRSLGRAAAT